MIENSRVSRRIVVFVGVALFMVIVAGVVVVRRTSWWSCGHDTDLRSSSDIAYIDSSDGPPEGTSSFIEQIETLPGVGDWLGSAPLEHDVAVTSGAGDDIVVSERPFFSARNEFQDTSFDPVSATVSWDRGQPGQMQTPRLVGDELITFGAVGGGSYRLTSLDAGDGDVNGCVELQRADDAGIGQSANAWSPDESAVAIATPRDSGSVLALIDLESRDQRWTADLDGRAEQVVWVDDVVTIGHRDPDLLRDGPMRVWEESRQDTSGRTSLVAVDGVTGSVDWTWPEAIDDAATPRIGTLLETVDQTASMIVVNESAGDGDAVAHRLVALDPATGAEVWSFEASTLPDAMVIGEFVLFDSGSDTGALDAMTGEVLWTEPTPAPSDRSVERLAVDQAQPWGELLLVPTWSGGAIVLDPATGDRPGIVAIDAGGSIRYWVTTTALAITIANGDVRNLLVFSRETPTTQADTVDQTA